MLSDAKLKIISRAPCTSGFAVRSERSPHHFRSVLRVVRTAGERNSNNNAIFMYDSDVHTHTHIHTCCQTRSNLFNVHVHCTGDRSVLGDSKIHESAASVAAAYTLVASSFSPSSFAYT